VHGVRVRRHIRIILGQLDEYVGVDPPKPRLVSCYSKPLGVDVSEGREMMYDMIWWKVRSLGHEAPT
jgi:hypothetical protein